MQRRNESRLTKLILNTEGNDPRGKGKPARHYLDSVKYDLNDRGYEWNSQTLDRVFWRKNVVRGSSFQNRSDAERYKRPLNVCCCCGFEKEEVI